MFWICAGFMTCWSSTSSLPQHRCQSTRLMHIWASNMRTVLGFKPAKTDIADAHREGRSCQGTLGSYARIHPSYSGDNQALESLIPPDTSTVLDVGCGRGGNAAWLARKGITVDGVSWNPEEVLAAKQFCRRVIQCDLNNGVPDVQTESYNCVICSHVLEHIAYPQPLLNDVERALAPGGFLLVAIPNLFFWSDRIKLVLGRWDYEESGTFD